MSTSTPSPSEALFREAERKRLELVDALEALTGLSLPRDSSDHAHALAIVRQVRPLPKSVEALQAELARHRANAARTSGARQHPHTLQAVAVERCIALLTKPYEGGS